MSDFRRRLQRLLVPDGPKVDGPTPHQDQDPIGNQELLRRMRQGLSELGIELPGIDVDVDADHGLHVDANLGSLTIGDTQVAAPRAELRAGLWNSEHGERQGIAAGTTGVTVTTPDGQVQVGRAGIRAGEMPDEDGQHIGVQTEYGLLRADGNNGSTVRVAAGDVEVGINDLAGGSSVGVHSDQHVFAADTGYSNFHMGSGTANWRVGEHGMETGGTIDLLGGGGSAGSTEQDPTRAERSTSLGLSEGEGLGVRARWAGDEDGDERDTVGWGIDVGPVSLDHTEEDPYR